MGVDLRDVIVAHPEQDMSAFKGRTLALDAYNTIYQFLSSIRQPDGTPLKIDTDYFGKKRNETNPSAGPFENPGEGKLKLKVW